MKKSIFLFFAAILCAMTANAQLYLRGGFNNWNDLTADYQFVSNVCNLELAGGTTYEFKIADSSWGTQFGGNHTFTATATKTLTSGGGNMKITTTIPGTYKFEFVQSTKKLTVTYPELPAPHDITVRAKVPAHWTNDIYAHVWTSENGSGQDVGPLTKNGDYYEVTKNAGALYVIFKNGSAWSDKNQTVDLCYTEDVCLQLNQSGTAKATATVIDCGAVAKDITVKAVVPGAWENTITAWVWPTGGEGKKVTPTKDGNWYVVTENCIELNVIFRNGEDWSTNENQTANIAGVTENTCYQISALNKDGEGKCTYTVVDCEAAIEPEAKPAPTPTFDYYVIGTINNWGLKDANFGMTDENADGVYEKEVTLAAGVNEIKVNNGTWDDGFHWGFSDLAVAYEETDNKDGNIKITVAAEKTITVKFDKNEKKITLEGLTEKAPDPIFDYYIVGSFNGDNPKKAENGMTLDGTVYKATVTLADGDHTLKVTNGTWEKTWGYTELGAAYEEVSNPNDGYNNIKITLAAEKEITVIFDATAGKITFDGLTPYVAPLTYTVTVPAGTEKCYIAGDMNGWAFQEMEAVTGETNKFTITIVGAKETDEYKYACQADWAYAEVIDGGGNRTNWSELDEVTAWNKPVVYTYYLMGVDGDWATGIEMEVNTDAENEVMLTCQPVNGEVKIKRIGDDESVSWYGGNSLKTADGSLGTNTSTDGGDGNILLEEGIYNFYFNTADGKLWIAAATDCETEPEYNVVEDVITNFVFDTEAWPMVCAGGPSTTYQVEVFLTLTEDADGTLSYEDCSVSIMGTDATFIDGTLSNIDPFAPYADAVLHVQWDGDYYELQLAMSSTPAAALTIEAEDATVTLTKYPTNFEATEFANELNMVANWVNEAESLPYTVEFVIPTFDPTKASGEYNANFFVTGEGDAAGMNENVSVTVTKDGNNVTLTGNVSALNGNAYNVTISGTLPGYTRTVELNQWGTICLPNASSSFTGATFYEVSSLDPAKGLWLDQLKDGAQLVAGKPYIFQATATEIVVTYTGEAVDEPVAGENGLTGTFTDIAKGGVLVDNYIIAKNAVWVANANNSLPANRAYINAEQVPTETQAEIPGRRRVCMGENAATGLDQIVAPEGQAVKAIVNGQLIIIRDGVKYNVQGQVIK